MTIPLRERLWMLVFWALVMVVIKLFINSVERLLERIAAS